MFVCGTWPTHINTFYCRFCSCQRRRQHPYRNDFTPWLVSDIMTSTEAGSGLFVLPPSLTISQRSWTVSRGKMMLWPLTELRLQRITAATYMWESAAGRRHVGKGLHLKEGSLQTSVSSRKKKHLLDLVLMLQGDMLSMFQPVLCITLVLLCSPLKPLGGNKVCCRAACSHLSAFALLWITWWVCELHSEKTTPQLVGHMRLLQEQKEEFHDVG